MLAHPCKRLRLAGDLEPEAPWFILDGLLRSARYFFTCLTAKAFYEPGQYMHLQSRTGECLPASRQFLPGTRRGQNPGPRKQYIARCSKAEGAEFDFMRRIRLWNFPLGLRTVD